MGFFDSSRKDKLILPKKLIDKGRKSKKETKADTQKTSSNVETTDPVVTDTKAEKAEPNATTNKPDQSVNATTVQTTGFNKDVDSTQFVDFSGTTPLGTPKDKVSQKVFFYKPTVDKKLTIVLIENTADMLKEKSTVTKLVQTLVKSGYIYVINYGSVLREIDAVEIPQFDYSKLLYDEDATDKACLYDALMALESVIYRKHNLIKEGEKEKVKINEIEVIGIGKCIDTCSKTPKDTAIDWFYDAISRHKILTKYFCLTEDTFINVAEVGFRSIGAIYQKFL